uniref:Cytochrome c oxidase assembly factor 3 mitochondrial coiled-coil domain-containing protein n=1 Tax=Hordeum vulgare subsp. vulgare TaxID=112509 RepID=A0A8I7B8G8_HORVV
MLNARFTLLHSLRIMIDINMSQVAITFTSLCPVCSSAELLEQMVGFGSLAPKTKNLVVGGGLTGFVFGVYYYTMRAVSNTDELQVAIDKLKELKKRDDAATPAANPSTPGSS